MCERPSSPAMIKPSERLAGTPIGSGSELRTRPMPSMRIAPSQMPCGLGLDFGSEGWGFDSFGFGPVRRARVRRAARARWRRFGLVTARMALYAGSG